MVTQGMQHTHETFIGDDQVELPLISVLIPLYNHQRYIGVCLNSVLDDGYPQLEIVVLDDGSSDDSLAIAEQWGRDNVHRVRGGFKLHSRKNRGITRTLNELVRLARGEYVILLASDDILLPGGIRSRLDYLRSRLDKLAVFGDSILIDQNGARTHESGLDQISEPRTGAAYQTTSHRKLLSDDQMLAFELVFNWSTPGPGFMARLETYQVIGSYDESLRAEDWDFYLRLASRGVLGYVDQPVAGYRMHGLNSVSTTATRVAVMESLMRTAAKNWRLFDGIKRWHLLAMVLLCKAETVAARGNRFAGLVFRISYAVIDWPLSALYLTRVRAFRPSAR